MRANPCAAVSPDSPSLTTSTPSLPASLSGYDSPGPEPTPAVMESPRQTIVLPGESRLGTLDRQAVRRRTARTGRSRRMGPIAYSYGLFEASGDRPGPVPGRRFPSPESDRPAKDSGRPHRRTLRRLEIPTRKQNRGGLQDVKEGRSWRARRRVGRYGLES